MLGALTGAADGRPDWVLRLEQGDDAGFFGPGSAAWAVNGGDCISACFATASC